jgi:CheY-like chemotaxis protein
MPARSVILLAEDDENQISLICRAFKRANFLNPLFIVRDGKEALAYLKGENHYSNRPEYPLPALLLLDLKMPRKNGFEVLAWIRQQPTLAELRVIVLTSPEEWRDVTRAYAMGADSFLFKPVELGQFVEMVQAIQGSRLWLSRGGGVMGGHQLAATPHWSSRRTGTDPAAPTRSMAY